MTLELLEDWLGCVREHPPGVLSKPQSMLAVDAFCGHVSHRIRNRVRNKSTNLMVIHSGMISLSYPFDVSVNKLFKHLVCELYDAWLNKDNHILRPPSVKIKRASVSGIVEWISNLG
jgi:hypothetical protein